MATEATLEILNDAHQAYLRCGDFMTCDDPRSWIRASNRLFGACIDAGMPYDTAVHDAWAAERMAEWLLSGPLDEQSALQQAA